MYHSVDQSHSHPLHIFLTILSICHLLAFQIFNYFWTNTFLSTHFLIWKSSQPMYISRVACKSFEQAKAYIDGGRRAKLKNYPVKHFQESLEK